MVNVVSDSIRSIASVSLLLLVFFYTYSVAGVVLFSQNDHLHFRDLATSMITMFRVVTLEGWTNILYINMYGCDEFGYEFRQNLCTSPEAHPIEAILYFTSFVALGTMIILNLFIAVVVDTISNLKIEQNHNKVDAPEKLEKLQHDLDVIIRKATEIRQSINDDTQHNRKAS